MYRYGIANTKIKQVAEIEAISLRRIEKLTTNVSNIRDNKKMDHISEIANRLKYIYNIVEAIKDLKLYAENTDQPYSKFISNIMIKINKLVENVVEILMKIVDPNKLDIISYDVLIKDIIKISSK